MTNYIPTRADELKVGDVVRWTDWFDGELPVKTSTPLKRGFVLILFDGLRAELAVKCAELLDRRVTPDEYERLSAPGDW